MQRTQSRIAISILLLALIAWVVWKLPATRETDSALEDATSVDSTVQAPAEGPLVASGTGDSMKRVEAPIEARQLALLLRRFPDDVPLSVVHVEVTTSSETSSAWKVTDDDGRLRVELAANVDRLVLHAMGFEPRELITAQIEESEPVALTPSSGLFGRVVGGDGREIEGVEVGLTVRKRLAQRLDVMNRAQPEVSIFESASVAASTRTNLGGWYFLPCETRNPGAPLRVVARSAEHGAAKIDVDIPRAPELLADLVLATPEVLVVKVVSDTGLPLRGAAISSAVPFWRAKELTDAEGVCRVVEPVLPAHIDAQLAGWRRKEMKIDGATVAAGTRVTSCGSVEIVLGEQAGARIRAMDGETGMPVLKHFGGWAIFLLRGEEVGRNSFEGERGVGWIDFKIRNLPLDVIPDRLRVECSIEGYRRSDNEFEIRAAKTQEPLELLLEPVAGFACIRGRALRNGEPVAGLEIGLRTQLRNNPRGWAYHRGYCDDDGSFAMKFKAEGDVAIVLAPHWKRWDEFAFLGPMSVEEATSKEHVLELRAAVRVPVILRNVVRSDRYTYHVALTDGDVRIGTTINGAPVSVETDGEAHTTMLLPGDRKASITIGYLGEGSFRTNASPPVHYDPARRFEPLVFDVETLYGRVSGRVLGFTAQELERVGVGLQRGGDGEASIVPVDENGSFVFPSAGLGAGKLLLFYEENGRTQLMAIAPVQIEGVVDGLTLMRDPDSLPATETR